jgi:hypothetical protein
MPAHAEPRDAAVRVETTLADTESDWDANATEILIIDPNVEGVDQDNIESKNIKQRLQSVHPMIRGLKSNSTFSHGMYMHAHGSSAAEAAAATATIQHTILKAALAGQDLGYAAGLSGGDVTNPTIDADPGFVAGDFGFYYDTDAGAGEFGLIDSISMTTLTQRWDLGFTPDGGGADVLHAVIDIYPNEDGLVDHDDANHITLGWKVQGMNSEDVYELKGCKPALGEVSITAGEEVVLKFDYGVVDWTSSQSATTFTSTYSGRAANIPGSGSTCSIKIGDFGSGLTEVDVRGTVTFRPNIGHDKVMGPNGLEGVHGYVGTGLGTAQIEIVVEYDNAYDTDWDNHVAGTPTLKHLLIQIGDTPTTAWGIYFPRLEYFAKPKRADEGGVTSHRLVFRCMEDTASVSGLTGDDIAKRRAPFHILIAA